MIEPAVAVTGLTKVFSVPFSRRTVVALRDLNLQVEPGQIYGLLGPNGSGKSTALKIILGLISPSRGTSRIFGRDSNEVTSREGVGFLPESPYFYKYLSGAETLRFYGRLCGLTGTQLRHRIGELLELVNLTSVAEQRLGSYSKGMLQRIGLAQALIHQPKLVLLDEPTAGVDPAGTRIIGNLIFNLKRNGVTVLLSSHLLEQVQEICDRVAILANGALVREGNLSDLLSIPDCTNLVLKNASPKLLNKIEMLTVGSGARLLEQTVARTSLERFFLQATQESNDPRCNDRHV
jgi:ABC-2 type transport system ATP-binding protein